jgi:hypothetical protein
MMRRATVALFCLIYLIVQIVVPALHLLHPASARFGWQMFARVPSAPVAYWLVLADGQRQPVSPSAYLGNERGDLDHVAVLPLHLCRTVPGVVAVHWQRPVAPGLSGGSEPPPTEVLRCP